MEKLEKLLEWLAAGNCVPYMEFYRIYDKDSLTQEDKDVFVKWLDINNIGLSPQKRIDAYMFINKDTNEFLTTKELQATKLPEGINFVYKQPEKKKECSNINTVTCNKFDKDCYEKLMAKSNVYGKCVQHFVDEFNENLAKLNDKYLNGEL